MLDANGKDKQAEFFNDICEKSKKPVKNRLSWAKIAVSLSYENIIILSIGLIMLLIACYSFGVERGKQLVQIPTQEIRIEQEQAEKPSKELNPQLKVKKIMVKTAQVEEIPRTPAYIQVACFRTDKYARKEIQGLKNKGYRPFIHNWGKYKVVCVGGYKNNDEARKALKDLKRLYADCILHDK